MQTEAAAYLFGRRKGDLSAKADFAQDAIFAAERVDGEIINKRRYSHCTFANISFLEAKVVGCVFEDCVFIGCYFRKTLLRSNEFKGCRFIGCDFPRIRVHSSRFGYCQFHKCFIEFGELKHNLPSEPNIRRDLTANIAHAAESLGVTKEARRYRLEAIAAQNEHLWAGFMHQGDWARDHFPGLKRLTALLQVVSSRLNGLIWGHGERWSVLVRFRRLTRPLPPPLTSFAWELRHMRLRRTSATAGTLSDIALAELIE